MQRFGAVHTYTEDVAHPHVTPRHAHELAASQCLSRAAIVMSVVLVSLVVLVGECVGVSQFAASSCSCKAQERYLRSRHDSIKEEHRC